jgi:hypothetical protein
MTSQTVPSKATTLDELRKVCRPRPLTGREMDAFFVETDKARNPHQRTRELLAKDLNEQEDVRILFYGHRGCGKSTELNKLLEEVGNRFMAVRFSVEEHMSMTAAYAEDLLLLVCERILQQARTEGMAVTDKALESVYGYFAETERTVARERGVAASIEVGAKAETPTVLASLLGLLAQFKGEIHYNAHSTETTVARLRKRPSDLVAQTNAVIEAVRHGLTDKRRLLVVVEDLDKLDLARARPMFVENVSLLAGVRTNIIYTVPVFLFHSPDAGQFLPHFDRVYGLPMIKVRQPGRADRTEGFDVVRQIVLERIEASLIEDEALNLLVENTGGVLRHVFQVLDVAATMTDIAPPLKAEHVEYGLQQLAKEFWSQISLPHDATQIPDCPKSVEDLYERLAECAKNQNVGKPSPCKSDATNQILLRSCALVEYNGEGWLGVHPIVQRNLRKLGRL